jgi:hypothetical protein
MLYSWWRIPGAALAFCNFVRDQPLADIPDRFIVLEESPIHSRGTVLEGSIGLT